MVPLAAIEKGQVRTVELPVTKTTMDNKDVFTLIPVVITSNGQTTVQQIPLWSKYNIGKAKANVILYKVDKR